MNALETEPRWAAFAGDRRLARGAPGEVALAVKRHARGDVGPPVLVVDEASGRPVDLDLSGSEAEVARRYAAGRPLTPAARGRGRPRLGVVGREVTLLPRHWAWLDGQRGGASATLRRLVDRARRESADSDRVRQAQDRTYRLMHALSGNRMGFEEACRALYTGDRAGFLTHTGHWPAAIRQVVQEAASAAFPVGALLAPDVPHADP